MAKKFESCKWIAFILKNCGKDMYIKYLQGKMTLDQFMARVCTDSHTGESYKVLDDMKQNLTNFEKISKPNKFAKQKIKLIETRPGHKSGSAGVDHFLRNMSELNIKPKCFTSTFF